jgi:hypothetical protein
MNGVGDYFRQEIVSDKPVVENEKSPALPGF